MTDPNYYIYISDSKIDMLISQISDEAKKTISNELKIDLKFFSYGRKTETVPISQTEKLEVVTQYINNYCFPGTIDEPNAYFKGQLSMYWGPLKEGFSEEYSMVYFGGMTTKTIVGLGGSSKNILGSAGDSSPFSHSMMPVLLGALKKEFKILDSEGKIDNEALRATHIATSQMDGYSQEVEFIARKLQFGLSPYPQRDKYDGMNVLLGTPIYVRLI